MEKRDYQGSDIRVMFWLNGELKGKFLLDFIPRVGEVYFIPEREDYDETGNHLTLKVIDLEISLLGAGHIDVDIITEEPHRRHPNMGSIKLSPRGFKRQ